MGGLYERTLPVEEPDDDTDEAVSVTKDGNVRLNLPTASGVNAAVTLDPQHAVKLAILIAKQAHKAQKGKRGGRSN